MVSCEFANRMIVIDVASGEDLRSFDLDVVSNGMPQDTRLTPDGSAFLVADMHAHGVYLFDGRALARTGFIPTGRGAHGVYFSRDGKFAYVSNRDEGSVSVIDLATVTPLAKWVIPNGSPDMGGLNADGRLGTARGRGLAPAGHLLARAHEQHPVARASGRPVGLRVGPSGRQYQDWRGPVYPAGVPQRGDPALLGAALAQFPSHVRMVVEPRRGPVDHEVPADNSVRP